LRVQQHRLSHGVSSADREGDSHHSVLGDGGVEPRHHTSLWHDLKRDQLPGSYEPYLAAMTTKCNEWTQHVDIADIVGVIKSE
jgi:hypothetical protein